MKLHPQNRAFVWEEHPGPFRVVTPEQAARYDRDGFFVVEEAFDADTIDALTSVIDPLEAQLEALVRERLGGRAFIMRADEISFTTHVVARSEVARRFSHHPFFQGLVHDLIGPDVRLYWDQAVYKKPGTEALFPWHQDNGYSFVEPQQYLTCWVALGDATLENGCPWVLPGRHRRGTLAHELGEHGQVCARDPEGAVPVPVRKGGVVVFSSLTPHATGPNRSDAVRKAYIVQFAPEGAVVVQREEGEELRIPADAPERQYPVLVGGRPV